MEWKNHRFRPHVPIGVPARWRLSFRRAAALLSRQLYQIAALHVIVIFATTLVKPKLYKSIILSDEYQYSYQSVKIIRLLTLPQEQRISAKLVQVRKLIPNLDDNHPFHRFLPLAR
jgi:hypothetical protein